MEQRAQLLPPQGGASTSIIAQPTYIFREPPICCINRVAILTVDVQGGAVTYRGTYGGCWANCCSCGDDCLRRIKVKADVNSIVAVRTDIIRPCHVGSVCMLIGLVLSSITTFAGSIAVFALGFYPAAVVFFMCAFFVIATVVVWSRLCAQL